jgi:hypothetical protein
VEKCHFTYVTYFTPSQEEQCQDTFEKTCQITFRQQATSDSVMKCYRPLEKVGREGPGRSCAGLQRAGEGGVQDRV